MSNCKNCGNNHRPGKCPPKKENRRTRQAAQRAEMAKHELPQRGMPVDGTGKAPASASPREGFSS